MTNHRKQFDTKQYPKIKLLKILQCKLLWEPGSRLYLKTQWFFRWVKFFCILFCVSYGSVLILVENCDNFIDLANGVLFYVKSQNKELEIHVKLFKQEFSVQKLRKWMLIISLKYFVQEYPEFKYLIILYSLSLITFYYKNANFFR